MKKKILLTILLCLALSSTFNLHAFAQETDKVKTLKESTFDVSKYLNATDEENKQEQSYLNDANPIVNFFLTILNFAIRIVGSIAIIIFIIAGFMFMFAQGNQQKVDEAKEVVKYGIIGILVVFLSYIIVISIRAIFIPEEQGNTTSYTQQEINTVT